MNITAHKTCRPLGVTLAVVFLAIILGLDVVRGTLHVQPYDLQFYISFTVTLLLVTIVLWFIFHGKNWARWVLLASFVLGLVYTLPEFVQHFQNFSALRIGIRCLHLVADVGVLFTLFHPSSSQWFKGNKGADS